MNDDMLSKSNEDLFSVPTYLKIDPETQRDVQLRLGYTTRYCEDDEIKIMVYNDFKKGEKMEIVDDFCKLRNVKLLGLVTNVTLKNSNFVEPYVRCRGFKVATVLSKNL